LLKCLEAGAKVKLLETIHGILSLYKKIIKNIIRKVFFICEPFITVTNNTNSYLTRDCEKVHSEGAKVSTNNKKSLEDWKNKILNLSGITLSKLIQGLVINFLPALTVFKELFAA